MVLDAAEAGHHRHLHRRLTDPALTHLRFALACAGGQDEGEAEREDAGAEQVHVPMITAAPSTTKPPCPSKPFAMTATSWKSASPAHRSMPSIPSCATH